jgi:hypothetical protein
MMVRILRLLARRGDGIEADVGEEDDCRAVMDAGESVGCERMVVRRMNVHRPHPDEQREHEELDRHHDVVDARAFLHADQEQPGDGRNDREGRQVHEDRNAAHVRRRLQQPMDLRIGAEEGRPVSGGQPVRDVQVDGRQHALEVVAPRDGDRHVAHRVLEDQVPPDDPRDQLAERGVRVRIRAPRLRNHRRQLGVAQAGEHAGQTEQHERQHERGAGAAAHHVTRGVHFPRGRGADGPENSGADHGADRQHDQVAGAERASQAVGILPFGHECRNRLSRKQ